MITEVRIRAQPYGFFPSSAGLFSKFFAEKYEKVIAIESSESACEDFPFNLDEFDNVGLYEGAAEEILPALSGQVSSLTYAIVDPPRAGIERHALDALISIQPRVLPMFPVTRPHWHGMRQD